MSVTPQGMSIQTLYRMYRDDSLLVNRQYQRKLVWTIPEKQRLIDSILQDFPLPLFLFAEVSADGGTTQKLEIIDGMQRLNAIFGFIEHVFTWNDKCFDLTEFARARQVSEAGIFEPFADDVARLAKDRCADFLDYQLAVTSFPGEVEQRITEVFGRINSGGKQLSDQERRQAGVLTPFAETVRELAAEIRGDVSKEVLLLSEMPQISIETPKNPHGYALKAEDIFWCHQGILRTNDLRDSEDEQVIADLCASVLNDEPLAGTSENLNKLYDSDADESDMINARLAKFGEDRLKEEVKTVFSVIRECIEQTSNERFFFRKTVYPKPTSNAQKSPFFAVFMAFHQLIFGEGLKPSDPKAILGALQNVAEKIDVGMKHMKSADLIKNIDVVQGLIRKHFVKDEPKTLAHTLGASFDLANSLRRSKIERNRYEYKQGLLRLDAARTFDEASVDNIIQTMCAVANVGPDSDGYIYIGIADGEADAARIEKLDSIQALKLEDFYIVGVDREAKVMGIGLDGYIAKFIDRVKKSPLSNPLKDQITHQLDTVSYKGHSVIRVRIPKQTELSFYGSDCYIRENNSTKLATAAQVAAISKLFP